MAKKKKYYVVWVGNEPGIYESWQECQAQIKGFPNATYRSFSSKEEAEEAFGRPYFESAAKGSKKKSSQFNRAEIPEDVIRDSWCVDAACSGNPGIMEYRGVETETGFELFHQGPFKRATNNIGEFLAIVHALALLKKQGDSEKVIYTDSLTAIAWIRNKRVKTMLKKTAQNDVVFDMIDKATAWIKTNPYNNKILKWDTKNWGEIPADFGRK